MQLPPLKEARKWQSWRHPDTIAWWILHCSGTPAEMREVTYALQFEWLGYAFPINLDTMLKEVVCPVLYASREVRRESTCQNCSATNHRIVAHHINYRRPLDVFWLCDSCHSGIHSGGASWLDAESTLDPGCSRASGTFSTRQFPLLDALWQLREELKPLWAERQRQLKDRIASDFGQRRPSSKESFSDPGLLLLQKAVSDGWKPHSLLELVLEQQDATSL